ncbi:uncharacterized protein F5Z01DRAFT_672536 [Emericellopsis atlantica]|uniref:Xylanolytic transcriptional activator regulatory domain-containing protein n=1 Tax=Emericellopsis atlantica TaxID=2614577 RepID=A0A9P7ZQL6_9HYPO|nr:uncharacterized protein F5Z01DRAFT_672536 [Emericellopsis atlantica]KAG9255890.1 hypothetical protein F5Z01DRAFT_672536 [Emericellopsis atlantica]
MFKFVADNVGGVGTKRKQSPRSCDSCKRRHKRCPHTRDPRNSSPLALSPDSPRSTPRQNSTDASSWPQFQGAADAQGARPQADTQSQVQRHAPQPKSTSEPRGGSEEAHLRFVADLSPESAFIINGQRGAGTPSISTHGVGLWLGQEHNQTSQEATSRGETEDEAVHVPPQVLDGHAGQPMLLSALRPALRRECIATMPPEYELGLLFDLFYAKIDPIFPLLRDEPWEKHSTMETVALKQCICLVASLDPALRPHLRLPHTQGTLSQIDFRARIAAAVKQSLDLGFIVDKVVLLQVCALMSMYVENEGFGELSTYYCAQAVLHEQTLGFHVGWPDGKAGGERSRRIFWCVYILDRLNAATNGRPTLIHRRDMDRKVTNSVDDQPPPFKLLIRIAQFLDYTISLYRPHVTAQAHAENADQTFEDLVEATGAQNLGNGMLASLELFYLSVVVLRGRSAGQRPSSELQWYCAARIVAVASGEFKPSLVFWPILPFAVTVAASVAYRSLRNSPMPYNRRRAYMLFHDSCEVLDELSKAFLSARAMARLAMDTMQEVERVATERTRRESIRSLHDNGPSTEVALVDRGGAQDAARDVDQQAQSLRAQAAGLSQPLEAGPGNPNMDQQLAHTCDQFDPNFFNDFDGEAGVFGNFDPSFDLGRIDAIFSANLDLGWSYFGEGWQTSGQFP